MRMSPRFLIAAVLGLLFVVGPAPGWVGGGAGAALARTSSRHSHHERHRRRRTRRKKHGKFVGHSVSKDRLRTEPLPAPSGEVWVYAENLHDEARVNIFGKKDAGATYDDAALATLDHVFRCKRTGEQRAVDPRLYRTLSIIFDHFGGKRITLVSGFRYQRDEGSRHYHASAMDIRIPGVSVRELYTFAESLDPGGMGIGIYPRAGFVHVDFRAPGEPSFRWTDRSGPSRRDAHRVSRRFKRKPES